MSQFLTAEQAARRLKVKVPTVYAYVSRGLLSPRKADGGRQSLFAIEDVEALAGRSRGGRERDARFGSIKTQITRLTPKGPSYRDRLVADLLDTSFEEVAGLVWGISPREWRGRELKAPAVQSAHDAVRINVALAAAHDPFRSDHRPEAIVEASSQLITTVVEALGERREAASGPRSISRTLAVWLFGARANDAAVAAVNAALVLLADHELSNPTLAVRLAADTRADLYDAFLAGLGVLGGKMHSGNTEMAHRLLQRCKEIGIEAALDEEVRWQGRLAGFSNVYDGTEDQRLLLFRPYLDKLLTGEQLEVLGALISTARDRRFPPPNIDLGLAALTWGSAVGSAAGPVLYSIARMVGWTAHYLEELSEPPMRFRAGAIYVSSRPS